MFDSKLALTELADKLIRLLLNKFKRMSCIHNETKS